MTKNEKFTFAGRNKSLCIQLNEQGEYYDWVVTTAFYSCIHFLEGGLLPCKINGCQCKNISEVKEVFEMEGRHAARSKLAHQYTTPQIASAYDWLDDQSRNSRYKTYKVNKPIAAKALYYLNSIAEYCETRNS